ncbi:hypothetical protein VTG60DRAFT_127 [Thermothelomyces hinnuleus]
MVGCTAPCGLVYCFWAYTPNFPPHARCAETPSVIEGPVRDGADSSLSPRQETKNEVCAKFVGCLAISSVRGGTHIAFQLPGIRSRNSKRRLLPRPRSTQLGVGGLPRASSALHYNAVHTLPTYPAWHRWARSQVPCIRPASKTAPPFRRRRPLSRNRSGYLRPGCRIAATCTSYTTLTSFSGFTTHTPTYRRYLTIPCIHGALPTPPPGVWDPRACPVSLLVSTTTGHSFEPRSNPPPLPGLWVWVGDRDDGIGEDPGLRYLDPTPTPPCGLEASLPPPWPSELASQYLILEPPRLPVAARLSHPQERRSVSDLLEATPGSLELLISSFVVPCLPLASGDLVLTSSFILLTPSPFSPKHL